MRRRCNEASLLAFVLAASACSGEKVSNLVFQPVGVATKVRVINAATPHLVVVRNDVVVSDAIPYGSDAPCVTVDSRTPSLGVRYGTTTALYKGIFVDNEYAYVVASTYDSSGVTVYQVMRVPIDSADGTNARVRVVNVSGAGPYDAHVTPVNGGLGLPIAAGITTAALAEGFSITPGEWRMRLTQAGSQSVAVDLGNRTFEQFKHEMLIVAPPDTGDTVVRAFFWSTGC